MNRHRTQLEEIIAASGAVLELIAPAGTVATSWHWAGTPDGPLLETAAG
ncbi:hypothetical protein [Haloterrigena salinisoli]